GFGSFRVRQRNARVGRNPKTGEKVEVPAKRVPYFKPSKELKDLINEDGTAPSPASESPAAPPNPQYGFHLEPVALRVSGVWRGESAVVCLLCRGGSDARRRAADRFSGHSQFHHPQSVSVHVRPLDGSALRASRHDCFGQSRPINRDDAAVTEKHRSITKTLSGGRFQFRHEPWICCRGRLSRALSSARRSSLDWRRKFHDHRR